MTGELVYVARVVDRGRVYVKATGPCGCENWTVRNAETVREALAAEKRRNFVHSVNCPERQS